MELAETWKCYFPKDKPIDFEDKELSLSFVEK